MRNTFTEFELADPDPVYETSENAVTSPFTGKLARFLSRRVVWPEGRREAVDAILASRKFKLDPQGIIIHTFPGRTKIHFFFGFEDSGEDVFQVAVSRPEVTEEAGEFLYQVVRASRRVLFPLSTIVLPIAVFEDDWTPGIEQEWPDLVRLQSKGDFLDWLDEMRRSDP